MLNDKTYAIFEPAFPYVYLPDKDYIKWQGLIASYYKGKQIHCNFKPRATCYFDHTCNHVRHFFDMPKQIFRFGDNTGVQYEISMDL